MSGPPDLRLIPGGLDAPADASPELARAWTDFAARAEAERRARILRRAKAGDADAREALRRLSEPRPEGACEHGAATERGCVVCQLEAARRLLMLAVRARAVLDGARGLVPLVHHDLDALERELDHVDFDRLLVW
jgi:hypothetical protein